MPRTTRRDEHELQNERGEGVRGVLIAARVLRDIQWVGKDSFNTRVIPSPRPPRCGI